MLRRLMDDLELDTVGVRRRPRNSQARSRTRGTALDSCSLRAPPLGSLVDHRSRYRGKHDLMGPDRVTITRTSMSICLTPAPGDATEILHALSAFASCDAFTHIAQRPEQASVKRQTGLNIRHHEVERVDPIHPSIKDYCPEPCYHTLRVRRLS